MMEILWIALAYVVGFAIGVRVLAAILNMLPRERAKP